MSAKRSSDAQRTDAPDRLSFRIKDFAPGAIGVPCRYKWGRFSYALKGVMELNAGNTRYLSPPHYAVWVPPNTYHDCQNRSGVSYISIYVPHRMCIGMASSPCTLGVSPLIKAILADFSKRAVFAPQSPEDRRLGQVLLDQLRHAPRYDSYLPLSAHPLLSKMLSALQEQPGDRRSLAEWARQTGTTERTLSRHCQQELGIPFAEWRQRLKLISALSLLESGSAVQSVARILGYNTPSAFIAMYRRHTGTTPAHTEKLDDRRVDAGSQAGSYG